MNPEYLEILKELNVAFCADASLVAKNFTDRKDSLGELDIDYEKDRVDRSLVCKDDSVLFVLDIEDHKASSLKEMIRRSYDMAVLIHKKFPGKFVARFSGRGFHLLCRLPNTEGVGKRLGALSVSSVWEFFLGVSHGIEKKCGFGEEVIDRNSRFNKAALIRGFCLNEKAVFDGHRLFCVPVDLERDDLDVVVSKSALLLVPAEFIIPTFDLWDLYVEPSHTFRKDVKSLEPLRVVGQSSVDVDVSAFPPCVRVLLLKKKLFDQGLVSSAHLGNGERFVLLAFLRDQGLSAVDIFGLVSEYCSVETVLKMRVEKQLEYISARGVVIRSCRSVKFRNLCVSGCPRRFLSDVKEEFGGIMDIF